MTEILKKENIILGCASAPKEEIIARIGQILKDSGYCTEAYVQGMLAKEKIFNTNIGNQIAIPHGIEEVRNEVLHSGMAMMIFPAGTDWGTDEKVKIVIGIAGKGEEHLSLLSRIAIYFMDPVNVEHVVSADVDEIYTIFGQEN
ncbi:MAG: PTS sugar transporter subunit IIA [Erysipelotrichaceae bacterium]|jgi:mannitol/fructose-specific phosphotransferase system IIA component|nr:PTS sugar transporter subunit IIA [Erysipelotrichaceae bacterium]